MIQRLGIQDEYFQSGSFTLYNPDGTVVKEQVKIPRTSSLFNPEEYPKQAPETEEEEEEESKGGELERG